MKEKQKMNYRSFEFDPDLLIEIKKIIERRATYGYRRVTALVNQALVKADRSRVNHKRIYRAMKENNLLLEKPCVTLLQPKVLMDSCQQAPL